MKKKLLFAAMSTALLFACSGGNVDYDASGVFESTEIIVSAQTMGEIVRMDIVEGESVEAGKTLAIIDTTQLILQKKQLLASVSATDSRRLDAGRQVASINQQIANLEKEQLRFASMLQQHAATQKQVDDISYQIAVLQKQKAAMSEQIGTTNNSLTGQRGSIIAQVEQLNDQLRKSYISSPARGTIIEKYMEKGEFATPGKPLFKVADLSNVFLRSYVPASQLTGLKIGQDCEVYADDSIDGRKTYKGHISWISEQAEFTPKTIQTRDERSNLVYAVKIAVKNDGFIKLGMYGDVKF